MPQIIVTAGDAADLEGTVTLRERINEADFESERFAANLLERLGWAVSDAADLEQRNPELEQRSDACPTPPEELELADGRRELVEA